MSNVNTVTVSGNLTRDPESVGKDTTVVKLGLAVNRQYKKAGDTEYTDEVSFFDITVFGNFGDLVARKLRKADRVTVQGRLKQDSWETPEGDKRSKVGIIADTIDSDGFFRPKEEDNAVTSAAPAPAEAPAGSPAPATAAPSQDDDIPF